MQRHPNKKHSTSLATSSLREASGLYVVYFTFLAKSQALDINRNY